jgi:hypothetical protein
MSDFVVNLLFFNLGIVVLYIPYVLHNNVNLTHMYKSIEANSVSQLPSEPKSSCKNNEEFFPKKYLYPTSDTNL